MNKVRTIFMGTPVFACSILNQLYEEERVELVAVISQPDRPTGRKKLLTPTPVKEIAALHGTPVLQPEKLSQIYEEIVAYNPELIITCAYGQMVSDKILAIPRLGCINVHASLLPKLRGGAPIHKAILFGEKETGITIMEMVHKMDAGDMIAKAGMPIDENMNMGQLHDALMEIGAELLHETLPSILDHSYVPQPQDEKEVTFAWNVSKEEEKIDIHEGYQKIHNHIRALSPYIGAYVCMDGKKVKLWTSRKTTQKSDQPDGTVIGFANQAMQVVFDNTVLEITELQPEGKGKMDAVSFGNGLGKQWIHKQFE